MVAACCINWRFPLPTKRGSSPRYQYSNFVSPYASCVCSSRENPKYILPIIPRVLLLLPSHRTHVFHPTRRLWKLVRHNETTPLVHCNTMNGFARNQGVATCIRSFLSSCQKCSEFFELCATNCMTEGNRHPPLKCQCKNPLHFILENFPLEWIYSSILVRKARIFFFCNV